MRRSITYCVSDVNKKAVYDTYLIIKEFLHKANPEAEECFGQMCYEVEKQRVLMPNDLFDGIEGFIYEKIEPIVYGSNSEEESCDVCQDGCEYIQDINGNGRCVWRFFKEMMEAEEEFDVFAMEVLNPFLVPVMNCTEDDLK